MENIQKKICISLAILFCAGLILPFVARAVELPTLSVSPNTGTFVVGSVFDVSLFLDTKGESVNAVSTHLSFPADKLQLVNPYSGGSVMEIWVLPPRFNNQRGTIELQGGMPGGLRVEKGLVANFTFRVKSVGDAVLRFLPDSKVLLNDGKGTNALGQTYSGIYHLVLPPPAGPLVVSETHSDQSKFYPNPSAILEWTNSDRRVDGYSYVINDEPVGLPDDISERIKTNVAYKNLSNGTHYFHIKALYDGVWGGVTHFAINIDTEPPAEFPVQISPSKRTSEKNPVIQFATTDSLSGVDHYEVKIISLNPHGDENGHQGFFVEAQSPYIPQQLEVGSYDIIIRAYDKANNYREIITNLKIVKPIFEIIAGEGMKIKDAFTIPWIWIWSISGVFLIVLSFIVWKFKCWYNKIEQKRNKKDLPDSVKKKLGELEKYKSKYGKALIFLLICGGALFGGHQAIAEIELGPPLISTVSRDISNEEIFYVGGKTETANSKVVIYFQSLQNGETLSEAVTSDKHGEWFYRHDTFLTSGDYLLWTQSKLGDQVSPPSPQVHITVRPTALQFGASRVSYEVLYLIIIIILFIAFLSLIVYTIIHARRTRRHYKLFKKETKEAEEAVRRGFASLRRDLRKELALIKKVRSNKNIAEEIEEREIQLLKDLEEVETYIGKEVLDIEKVS